MPLLDRADPNATRESVIRHAVIWAVVSAVVYPIAAAYRPLLWEFWPIGWPLAILFGAGLGARSPLLNQWDNGVRMPRDENRILGIFCPNSMVITGHRIAPTGDRGKSLSQFSSFGVILTAQFPESEFC